MLIKASSSKAPAEILTEIPSSVPKDSLLWVNVVKPTEQELAQLKQRFALDDYAMEDVSTGRQRPKIEDYGPYAFSVIHIPAAKEKKGQIDEMFVFFEKNWLISICRDDVSITGVVQTRVKTRGLAPMTVVPAAEFLFYLLLDLAVDAYYPPLDAAENQIESLDSKAVASFRHNSKRFDLVTSAMSTIGTIRKKLMLLRGSLVPTRDMIGMIMRGTVPFVTNKDLRSFRDVYDHSFQLLETIDTYRDRTSDVRELYINLLNASTDNIIKLLTIVATIFLPLSLLAGIYGMNFTPGFFTPGSGSAIGFYVLIGAMLIVAGTLLYSFRKHGWI